MSQVPAVRNVHSVVESGLPTLRRKVLGGLRRLRVVWFTLHTQLMSLEKLWGKRKSWRLRDEMWDRPPLDEKEEKRQKNN